MHADRMIDTATKHGSNTIKIIKVESSSSGFPLKSNLNNLYKTNSNVYQWKLKLKSNVKNLKKDTKFFMAFICFSDELRNWQILVWENIMINNFITYFL